ncbi:hypothetical protein BST83_06815 [Polaribacter filamentus]|uniref:Uncharacterized protein n=1 Tax=Polaribacter filamentus TaxID=53483 RepID=A0A2S7KW74_9FLAO|nr:hypothetical protein [Polaribacter filamentus]PQB06895.1 hypothetical protein BST83_06815 [Polaribacter filamentus]
MKSFITIIKLDYLQRTRSYTFLVTLCASLAIAYTFVPEPNATYSTIRIADYVGYYNSAWFGYVTAIMTSIFLSLIGFYLVNSSIKTDIDTKVGQIIAATKINNFKYLFSKIISNFLLLLTIILVVFIMSIILFFLYNDDYALEIFQFIKPYALITIPAMFLISIFAVVFEMFLGKYSVVQNVIFFFIFCSLMLFSPKTETQFSFDIFGSKIVMHQLEESVQKITNTNESTDLAIGYVLGNVEKANKFQFDGIDFPISFIISRFIWIVLGILLIFIVSPFFHRFNIKERTYAKKESSINNLQSIVNDISLLSLPKAQINYNIFPLLRTEFLLLFRKGKRWLWFINIVVMILLAILPLKIAHQIVLPILWFLQVSRLSVLTTKELDYNVQYFVFTSNKPISRLLFAQIVSGILLVLLLAFPLLIRLGISYNFVAVVSVLLGGVFITLFAATLGILSKGKKLFEVLFFIITYANINGIIFADYFGGYIHNSFYLIRLAILILLLGSISAFMKKYELDK